MIDKNENSRISRIQDHNIYTNTDHLYDPLRNALLKSTFSPNGRISTQYNNSISKIGKNMRSLSPAEADIIKNSIFIPIDKQLVPTRNLQKIMGKQFIAIDMEQKVGRAISPTDFSRIPSETIEEIVYEIQDEEENKRTGNIYTTRKNMQASRTIQSPFINMNSMSRQSSYQRNSLKPEESNNNLWTSYQSKQLLTQPSTVNYGKNEIGTSRMRQSEFGNEAAENVSRKKYAFKQKYSRDPQNKPIKKRGQQNYKYNLFSMADELGNNGCKSGCFNNEVIASKINNNPWK